MAATIAYIMSRFPHLPETFILREMNELERSGEDIKLYPLIKQRQPVVHRDAKPWLHRARYHPYLSLPILKYLLNLLWNNPGSLRHLLGLIIQETRPNLPVLLRSLILFPKILFFAREMQEENIQHIHAHYATYPALAAWIIHHLTGIPYSITIHAHDIFVQQTMLAPKLKEAKFIVSISEYNRQFILNQVSSRLSNKIYVIHCGIEPEWFSTAPARKDTGRSFTLLTVGSLQTYKGHTVLFEALHLLKSQDIPFQCHLVGGGELENRLKNAAYRMGLDDNLRWHGSLPQEEVIHLYPEVDCYIQPSVITQNGKMEGIPVAIMEALAAGLPVVASDLSGIPELVHHQGTGYLFPPGDSNQLADILFFIYHHPEQARKLGRAGQQLVKDQFAIQNTVQKLRHLFHGLDPGITSNIRPHSRIKTSPRPSNFMAGKEPHKEI